MNKNLFLNLKLKTAKQHSLKTHPNILYKLLFSISWSLQFSRSGALPPILHVVWTPLFTRVWTHQPDSLLMGDILSCLDMWYFEVTLYYYSVVAQISSCSGFKLKLNSFQFSFNTYSILGPAAVVQV